MQFVAWVETMIAGQSVAVQHAAVLERQCLANIPTKLGLTLQEGRAILTGIEQEATPIVTACASPARQRSPEWST